MTHDAPDQAPPPAAQPGEDAAHAMAPAVERPFSVRPLMIVVFACSVAMMVFIAMAGPIARVLGLPPWQIGAAMTIAGIGWMLMARPWGRLSDARGRRKILLAGLGGFTLSYLLLALFIDLALRTAMAPLLAFAGILIGRGAMGLFYAAVPATSAALVADHVVPRGRGAAMAALGAASATGMVLGPGFAGLVAPAGLSLPLYATVLLPLAAFAILARALPPETHRAPPPGQTLRLFDPRLRRPMAVAFVAMFSVAIAQITVGFFALDRLGLSPTEAARVAGFALATVGVALVCAQAILRKLGWAPARLIRVGATIGGLGFASVILATSPLMLCLSYGFAAFGMGWVYPSVSALAANSVEAYEQGAAAGTIAAAQGFGSILGPIVGTVIYGANPGAPYAVIGIVLIVIALWRSPAPHEPPREP